MRFAIEINTANGQELRAMSVASASVVLDPNSSYGIIPCGAVELW